MPVKLKQRMPVASLRGTAYLTIIEIFIMPLLSTDCRDLVTGVAVFVWLENSEGGLCKLPALITPAAV
jgi:hypothetical protein